MIAFRTSGPLDDSNPRLALLWEHGCLGILEDRDDLLAYFAERLLLPVEGRWEPPDETDYVAAYRASLKPIRLNGLVVAPTHRTVRLSAGQKVLWLDPGMAFGSGHHETTRLALEALVDCDLRGHTVLDVGSGSGILAIAADLLGAASATGLDHDAATIPVARANAALNRSRASFRAGELDASVAPASVDVLVANLYAELHVALMPAYARALRSGGSALLSGILRERGDLVRAGAAPLAVRTVRAAGDWLLLALGWPA